MTKKQLWNLMKEYIEQNDVYICCENCEKKLDEQYAIKFQKHIQDFPTPYNCVGESIETTLYICYKCFMYDKE